MPRPDLRSSDTPAPVTRRPPVPPRRVAPHTTVAPFQVPGPEARPDKYSPERLAETPLPGSPPPGLPVGRPATPAARAPEPPSPRTAPPSPRTAPPSPRTAPPPSARTAPPALPPGHPSAPVPDPTSVRPARPEPVRAGAREEVGATPRSTGPTGVRADRPRPASAALAAGLRSDVLPGQAGAHPSGPVYGDWTRPSRSAAEEDRGGAPATSAIPERDTARDRRGGSRVDDRRADEPRADDRRAGERDRPAQTRSAGARSERRGPAAGPGTGSSPQVRGGRAADRAARKVVDDERRKELKRRGETMTARAYLDGDDLDKKDLDSKRSPRRKVVALIAVAVVALGVLGVYSFISPATQQASAGRTATSSAATPPSGVAATSLPPLSISPPPAQPAPPADVKAPVTVLNATSVNGLAGRVAGALEGGGWEAPTTGGYTGGDVAVTTVYFTEGNETQRQAAVALVTQFPQIHGPAPRFFDVPDQPDPGLVVITAGDWQP